MKKSKKIIFVVVAIIAILVSFLGGQAYAKYMSKVTGNGTAEIASWKFKVNENEEKMQTISLSSTVNNFTLANKKVAPGTSGSFNILLEANKNSKYKINFISVNEKPQNLHFKALKDEEEIVKADTLEKLSEKLEGNINKKESIKIEIQWYWDFENNKTNSDIQDTEDSKKIKRYQFNLYALGEEI